MLVEGANSVFGIRPRRARRKPGPALRRRAFVGRRAGCQFPIFSGEFRQFFGLARFLGESDLIKREVWVDGVDAALPGRFESEVFSEVVVFDELGAFFRLVAGRGLVLPEFVEVHLQAFNDVVVLLEVAVFFVDELEHGGLGQVVLVRLLFHFDSDALLLQLEIPHALAHLPRQVALPRQLVFSQLLQLDVLLSLLAKLRLRVGFR